MRQVLLIAKREFLATVLTKGFLVGILLTPLLVLLVVGAVILVKGVQSPRLNGSVALIDRSGLVGAGVQQRFAPGAQDDDDEETAQAKERATRVVEQVPVPDAQKGMVKEAIKQGGKGADLQVELLPGNADAEEAKKPLQDAVIRRAGDNGNGTGGEHTGSSATPTRLAVVVVPEDAVRAHSDGSFAPLQVFTAPRLDFEVQAMIEQRVREAVVDARIGQDARFKAGALSAKDVRAVMARPGVESKVVSKTGDKSSLGAATFILPIVLMGLLMSAVFVSGQYLLTSTVEEKGNRVMEVLLSAVSPVQLLSGKILGYMCVGLLILVMYSGMGIIGLVIAARADLVNPVQLLYLLVYFMIAYAFVACVMAAAGSAVNDTREAQTLLSPFMMLMMIPWFIWFLIQRAPNSMIATVLSFVPGPSPFVMMIRLGGSEPVPFWQIPASMLLGVASVVVAVWAAAKIFRIGVLMYGKPPNLATLLKWVRMA